MPSGKYRYLFGPVLSRRLGKSLGVDIVPFKTCSYDCIYCELGRTTKLTARREDHAPCEEVLAEIKDYLDTHPAPDYITLSGSGEPTLHAQLGRILADIKASTTVPVAVLTNGSLLWDGAVRDALSYADLVLPSLDAGDPETFARINRPAAEISFEQMVTGLVKFRESFNNAIWLEVMLVAGINSGEPQPNEIGRWIQRIRPDRIQVNTVVRPPAEPDAKAVSPERLKELAASLDPDAEIIADYVYSKSDASLAPDDTRIVDLVRRRPCSAAEIAAVLGLRVSEAVKALGRLTAQELVTECHLGARTFYTGIHKDNRKTQS